MDMQMWFETNILNNIGISGRYHYVLEKVLPAWWPYICSKLYLSHHRPAPSTSLADTSHNGWQWGEQEEKETWLCKIMFT